MEEGVLYLGEKLRLSRLRAGIATQKELSKRTGISPTIISDLERGRRDLSYTWANRIAEVVGIPTKALMEEE